MLACVHFHPFSMIMLTGQMQDPAWWESSDMLFFSCSLCSFIHLSDVFKRSRVTLVTSSCWESILEYFLCNWLFSTTTWILFWNISNCLPGWLAIHQDTHLHGPANILFFSQYLWNVFMVILAVHHHQFLNTILYYLGMILIILVVYHHHIHPKPASN